MGVQLNSKYTSSTDPVPWSAYAIRTEGSENPDVLYYLHGGSSHPKSWVEKPALKMVRDHWEQIGFAPPIVVCPSFGDHWLLASGNVRHSTESTSPSGLFESFVDRLMPTIEAELVGSNFSGRRLLFGSSMGGFNAAQLILRRPELFASAVLTSPGFSTFDIYEPEDQIAKHGDRLGAQQEFLDKSIRIAKAFFPDPISWRDSNPLELGKTHLGPATPPLYISCGKEDLYGFFEGARDFAELARKNGAPEVHWESLPGGHSDMNPTAVARFLAGFSHRTGL